ncbi:MULTISPECIES: S-layer homology domain-containing protein [Paenibacillus]|uniref:SLH domain-containing protein n=1 Tax=Paenibacillus albilobatus TaxID=2716884 RepID=A0A919XD79_9BACL|nr:MULTISPECIES: S-layer homology domain-containing protein [Paenibacillus]GIO28860.1 hypothetical protein J2TS6_00010 [Paenibacillus albilobatus]
MKKSLKVMLTVQTAITLGIGGLFAPELHADRLTAKVPFADMKSHWSADSVAWALSKNIVRGYEDGTFKPNQPVTEAEFLSMLIHSCRPDVANGTPRWAEPYYMLAESLNYPVSSSDIKAQNQPITRLRVAELIASAEGMNYEGDDAIRFMYGKGLAKGEGGQPTITSFNGSKTLTRAEAVQFIKNLSDHGSGEMHARPATSSDTSKLPDIPFGNEKVAIETGKTQNQNTMIPVLKLDDKPIAFKTKPVVQNGIVYFPIEEVCAAFGISYQENADGSVTTTNGIETNTFRSGEVDSFIHNNPKNPVLGSEEIPLDGQNPMKKINGVFMIPAESTENLWFAVNKDAKKYADMMVIANGQEDQSELKFYTYKQNVLTSSENMDGTNKRPGGDGGFEGEGKVNKSIWVKEYTEPSLGTNVYATWRWSSKDDLFYKFKEVKFTGSIVNGTALGMLEFSGDITYYKEDGREEQLKPAELQDIKLPYKNGDILMTWNDLLKLFSKHDIILPD